MTGLSPTLLRTEALLGTKVLRRLQGAHVLVVGLGAVGGACLEALARSGIGRLTLVDGDVFEASNLNRQPFSAASLIGCSKAEATRQRLQDIAPTCIASAETQFVTPLSAAALLAHVQPDAVVDAIDDLPAKAALLEACVRQQIPVWSAMGAARKLDPAALRVTDLSQTHTCPLARTLRQQLRKRGISRGIRCVWSKETPRPLGAGNTLGSYMPVTASAGLFLAADLIQTLIRTAEPPQQPTGQTLPAQSEQVAGLPGGETVGKAESVSLP